MKLLKKLTLFCVLAIVANVCLSDDMDEDIIKYHSKVPNEFAWNHKSLLENVIDSILKNQRGLIDGLEGRKSVELINAIYESIETGKEIQLRFKPSKCKLGVL